MGAGDGENRQTQRAQLGAQVRFHEQTDDGCQQQREVQGEGGLIDSLGASIDPSDNAGDAVRGKVWCSVGE
jgi:hypothetical protein